MSTSKSTSADVKGVRKANETALKGFPKSKIRAAFERIAALKSESDTHNKERQSAALEVCKLAVGFRKANSTVSDLGTVTKGWRDHMSSVVMELAVAGNKFAELTPADKDKAATAKLTGYGNNVASIAKGCIEHEMQPGTGDLSSYRDVRKAVEAARAEARRTEKPDEAALNDAKAACDEAWSDLRKLVYGLNAKSVVEQLALLLMEQIESINEQKAEQAAPEADAPETTPEVSDDDVSDEETEGDDEFVVPINEPVSEPAVAAA